MGPCCLLMWILPIWFSSSELFLSSLLSLSRSLTLPLSSPLPRSLTLFISWFCSCLLLSSCWVSTICWTILVLYLWFQTWWHEKGLLFLDHNEYPPPIFSQQQRHSHCSFTLPSSSSSSSSSFLLSSTATASCKLDLSENLIRFWNVGDIYLGLICCAGFTIWGENKTGFYTTELPQQMQRMPPMHGSSSAYNTESQPSSTEFG